MPHLILATKLHIPSAPHILVERSHLLKRLENGLTRSLTLVCAPAGSGKSTLLSYWLRYQGHEARTAWLSLDESDNDLERFVAYLVAGMNRIDKDIGQLTEALLESSQPQTFESLLTPLLNDITHQSDTMILILDDYHVIHNLVIHDALSFLLSHKPQHCHVVIASRHDPPFPLGQMRVRSQLNEIRTSDLNFSHDETTAFFESVVGITLNTQNIQALTTRTEGWVAGLQLAGLALQEREDISDFISRFAGDHTYLVDYLGEEVFNRQSQNVRDFLLKTAILNRLCPTLCDSVTENSNGREILETLRQANLFLIPLDDRREWYRYHHLFADLLFHYLQQTYPDQIAELHHRASIWYEQHKWIDDAIYHASEGQNDEHIADMIEIYGLDRIAQHQFRVMQKYLHRLPDSLFQKRPYLSILQAWNSTALSQPIHEIEKYLKQADAALQRVNDTDLVSRITGQTAMIRGYSARRQHKPTLALQLLEEASRLIPEDDPLIQCFLNLDISGVYWIAGRFSEMENALQRTLTFPYQAGMRVAISNAAGDLAELYLHFGKLRQAIAICEQYINLDDNQAEWMSSPYLYYIYARLGLALYERNEIDSALDILNKTSITAQRIINTTTTIFSLTALTWLKLRQQYPDEAMELWKEVRRVYEKQSLFYDDFEFDYHQVRLWLEQGNIEDASDWAYQYTHTNPDRTNWNIRLDIVLARVRIAEKELDTALHILETALKEAEVHQLNGWLIQGLIVQAIAYDKKRQREKALQSLAHALSLAEPEGYIRTFVDEGAILADLLTELITDYTDFQQPFRFSTAYASKLLAIINQENQVILPLYEELTERELTVLRLVASGLSNQEIADELFVTLGAVKKHNQRIYRKLDVSNRTQAIKRAQELHLL